MSEKRLLIRDIEVEPKYINKDIQNNILTILKSQKLFSEEIGYIIDILEIKHIESLPISNITKYPIFKVKFLANTLLPKIDKKLDCKVTMIFPQGIFMEHGPVKVLLPENNMKNYLFKEGQFKKGKKSIKVGDTIEVILTNIKYEKGLFNCICKLEE